MNTSTRTNGLRAVVLLNLAQLLVFVLAPLARAQTSQPSVRGALAQHGGAAAPGAEGSRYADARERWGSLSPEERLQIAARFERWRSMGDEERARIRARFEQIEKLRGAAHEALPETVKRKLDELGPSERRDALHGVLAEEIDERGRRMLTMLPREWRERFEQAAPAERMRLIEDFRHEGLARAAQRVEKLAREQGLDELEVARLRALPPGELLRKLMEFERRGIERGGVPPFCPREQWEQWRELPDERFVEKWSEARRCSGRGPEGPRSPLGDPAQDSPRMEKVRALRERLRPDPSWIVDVAGATREQKREQIGARIRPRVVEYLEGAPDLIAPAQLAELRQLQGRAFAEALTRAIPELRPPWMRDRGEHGERALRGERGAAPPRDPARPGEHPRPPR